MSDKNRRKVFDKHLVGLELGEADFEAVEKKLGAPSRKLAEEKVTVFEYDDPKETSIARFKKMQCIFFDDLLLNVSYVEPDPKLSRKKLHGVLGEPDDESQDDEEDEDGEEGLAEIFDVETDEEPTLSFAAHYDDEENLEALSLCAEIMDDEDLDGDDAADEG
jgi:hypothetical protein